MRSFGPPLVLYAASLIAPAAAYAVAPAPECVGLALPTGMICRSDLQCTFPVSMDSAGLPVGSLTAHVADSVSLACPGCVAGGAASNGECTVIESTCNLQVVDLTAPFNAFADGEVAAVTIECATQGDLGELCVMPISAFAPDGITEHATCEPSCVPYACRSCLSGDCNRNERRDGGDTICAARCLVGLAAPGSNCGCGADCNCVAGTEAADITCTILRNLQAFGRESGDPCDVPAPAALQFVQETAALRVAVRLSETKPTASGRRSRSFLGLGGRAADEVGALRVSLSVDDGRIAAVRLARRLAAAGFELDVQQSGERNAVAVIRPPAVLPLPAMGRGRALKVVVPRDATGLAVGHAELGSTAGLPMASAPAVTQ